MWTKNDAVMSFVNMLHMRLRALVQSNAFGSWLVALGCLDARF